MSDNYARCKFFDRRLAKLDSQKANASQISAELLPTVSQVLEQEKDLKVEVTIVEQLKAASIYFEPFKHDPETLTWAEAMREDPTKPIMRRLRVYDSGEVLKASLEAVTKAHGGFAPMIAAFVESVDKQVAFVSKFTVQELWDLVPIWEENKGIAITVRGEFSEHLQLMEKQPALRVCIEKKVGCIGDIYSAFTHCLIGPLCGYIINWTGAFLSSISEIRAIASGLSKTITVEDKGRRFDESANLLSTYKTSIASISDAVPDEASEKAISFGIPPSDITRLCRVMADRIERCHTLSALFLNARFDIREKVFNEDTQRGFQSAVEACEEEVDWQTSEKALTCTVVTTWKEQEDRIKPFFQNAHTINKQLLQKHWADLLSQCLELGIKTRPAGAHKALLALAGNPTVKLMPVVLNCLPTADDKTLGLFDQLGTEANTFIRAGRDRVRSAVLLGKKLESISLETLVHQHSIVEKGAAYIAKYLRLTKTMTKDEVLAHDSLITLVVEYRRVVLLYKRFVESTDESGCPRTLGGHDIDAQECRTEALSMLSDLDTQFLDSWVKNGSQASEKIDQSIRELCDASLEKSLCDVESLKHVQTVWDKGDDFINRVQSDCAKASMELDSIVKRIEEFIDLYDELTYMVTLHDKHKHSMKQFASMLKVVSARGKKAVCCISLWDLILDEIPSQKERRDEGETLTKEINGNIDHQLAPFPSKLLLLLDGWMNSGNIKEAFDAAYSGGHS